MALLVGEHSVRALRRLEQDAARGLVVRVVAVRLQPILHVRQPRDRRDLDLLRQPELLGGDRAVHPVREPVVTRSEEHTSELQSQSNLVCRLLLEKKKKKKKKKNHSVETQTAKQTPLLMKTRMY